ncbi:MAG: RloB family protein, partial [Candidatus Marinimicrobia bacterium]|nr:RloB family protein [Candidatus Neomarinimicrobiota bacterium]
MRRKAPNHSIKKSILIVGEGVCEQIYFKQLNSLEEFNRLCIDTKTPPHPMPTDIASRALALKREGEYDAVWCIFDMDKENENPENYKKALKKANDNNIYVAKVFPCFELWLLLHFNKSLKPYSNCKNLTKDLKNEIPDY